MRQFQIEGQCPIHHHNLFPKVYQYSVYQVSLYTVIWKLNLLDYAFQGRVIIRLANKVTALFYLPLSKLCEDGNRAFSRYHDMVPYVFFQSFQLCFINIFCILIIYLFSIWENHSINIWVIIKRRIIYFPRSYTIIKCLIGVTNVGFYAVREICRILF